jgi:Ser/Thr protein kinase RdoA (MazF antagonist)
MITTADRRLIKGIQFNTEGDRIRVEGLLEVLGPSHFPSIIASTGSALLTEWVAGEPLDATRLTSEQLRSVGEIQGWVHSHPFGPAKAKASSRKLIIGLHRLVLRRVLTIGEASALGLAAKREKPSTADRSVIHRDFAPDNLVLTPEGGFKVIDIETLTPGFCEFDLARTWLRWPMLPAEFNTYLEGYSRYRSPEQFLRSFWFWAATVSVESLLWHLSNRTGGAATSLARLRAAIAGELPLGVVGFPKPDRPWSEFWREASRRTRRDGTSQ